MQLKTRVYTHDLNEVLLGITVENELNDMGLALRRIETWNVQGKIVGTNQADARSASRS